MIQTGIKQATIAYRVSAQTGEPLDVNGDLISASGLRQAIALLTGTANPNPSLYEVMTYFNADALLDGEPTTQPSADCPAATFNVSPLSVTLTDETLTADISVESSGAWSIVGSVPSGVTLSQTSGTGSATITATRTGVLGVGTLLLKSNTINATVGVSILNLESASWILTTGFWRDYKIWKNDGLWKF